MTASQPPAQPRPVQPQPAQPEPRDGQHRRTGVSSWGRALAEWRNWRLPVKVAALLFVPAIAAVSLGAVQIRSDVSQATSYSRVQQLVALRTALTPLATDLQAERLLAVQKLGTTTAIDVPAYYSLNGKVDKDAQAVAGLGGGLLDPNSAAGLRYQGLLSQINGLGALHQQALNANSDLDAVQSNYTTVISGVLDFEQALSPQLGDPALTGAATAMTDMEVAKEQVRQEQALVTVAIARGQMLATELTSVRQADVLLLDRVEDFQVVATPPELAFYQKSTVTSALNDRETLAQEVLANGQTLITVGNAGTGTSLGVPAQTWTNASNLAATQVLAVADQLGSELASTSAVLQDQASNAAGIEAVILFAVLLVAVGVGVIVGRHLLRSLAILRGTALEVAERRLPEVVASIDQGHMTNLEIEPVPVDTHEELGQLARAFDAVHGQAVRSAVGQATLRANLRNIFINLSRRSQSLVERQLRLMEKLERNEEDPQQLANLFRLDHLATRMRRNNENLMVLSGDDPARRSGHPLPLADVLRAAVSEIEQYQRVVVRSTPSVDVLGYASGDLVRLIAELLDNATSFSPPKTHVRIGGETFPDGSVRIEIRDEGIGMAEAELSDANGRLTAADTADVPVSRQMGLYVVGRLAKRHSIEVTLESQQEGGLVAVVQVPAELVKAGTGPQRPGPDGQQVPPSTNGHARNGANGVGVNGGGVDGSVEGHNGNGSNGGWTNGNTVQLPGRHEQPSTPNLAPMPEWSSFTGSSFADSLTATASLEPTGFTWFDRDGVPRRGQPPAVPHQQSLPQQQQPVRPAAAPPPAPAPAPEPEPKGPQPSAEPLSYTAVGLPRRVPRSNLSPSLAPQQPSRQPAARPRPEPVPVNRQSADQTQRNPSRARGFLNDYQAGIRQGAHARPEPATENGQGQAQ